jgi:hypothetical protein
VTGRVLFVGLPERGELASLDPQTVAVRPRCWSLAVLLACPVTEDVG